MISGIGFRMMRRISVTTKATTCEDSTGGKASWSVSRTRKRKNKIVITGLKYGRQLSSNCEGTMRWQLTTPARKYRYELVHMAETTPKIKPPTMPRRNAKLAVKKRITP